MAAAAPDVFRVVDDSIAGGRRGVRRDARVRWRCIDRLSPLRLPVVWGLDRMYSDRYELCCTYSFTPIDC